MIVVVAVAALKCSCLSGLFVIASFNIIAFIDKKRLLFRLDLTSY